MNMMMTMEPPGALQLRDARRRLRFRKLVALFERDEIERAVDALIAELDYRSGEPRWDMNASTRPRSTRC